MNAWARVALAVSILLFALPMAEKFENPKAAAVRVFGLGALAALASHRRLTRAAWTPLDGAVILWLGTEVVVTVLSSAPALSLFGESIQREGLMTSIALAGLYGAARVGTRDGADVGRTLDVALAAAAVTSVYALLQAVGVDVIRWAPRVVGGSPIALGRPSGTLGHPNLLGVIGAAAVPLALAGALDPKHGRWWRAVGGLACLGATLVTLSRAAWLGLIAGAAVVAVARLRLPGPRRPWPGVVLSAAMLAGLIAVLLATGGAERVAARWSALLQPGGSVASRVEIWRAALDAWMARPWTGWGPDTFAAVFPRFQTPDFWRVEWGLTPFHAHSIYLQTLATRGIAGLATAVIWGAGLLAATRLAWRRAPDERPRMAALLGMLAALAVSGAFGALGVAGAVLVVVASGTLAGLAAPAAAQPPRQASVRAGLLAAGVVTLWAATDFQASCAEEQARIWLDRSSSVDGVAYRFASAQALEAAGRAARWAPLDDSIARLRADALLAAADVAERPRPLLSEATAEARRALRLVPQRSSNELCLGRVLGTRVALGDRAAVVEGRAALVRAARLAPANALFLGECSRMALLLGDVDLAVDMASEATRLYPRDGSSQAMLARALVRSGDPVGGAAAFRSALAGDWHGDSAGRAQAARELGRLRRHP